MTSGYDITGISPLGLNLGSAFGDYSSYMPSSYGMMGMNGMTGMGGSYGGYGMGMTGMMAPMMEYQQYMKKLQNQLELEDLHHTNAMHSGMINNEVQAHRDSLSGIVKTVLADSSVQGALKTLHSKVLEGDQNGIVQEYDKLERIILARYNQELKTHGTQIARAVDARELIETAYNNMFNATATDGLDHSLEKDIERYCDSAFKQGIVSGFRGENNQRYREETINHIYGKRINNRDSLQEHEAIGKGIGVAGSIIRDVGEGAAIGAGAFLGAGALANLITLLGKNKWWFKGNVLSKGTKGAAIVGIVAMGAHDIIKRINNKNS